MPQRIESCGVGVDLMHPEIERIAEFRAVSTRKVLALLPKIGAQYSATGYHRQVCWRGRRQFRLFCLC